MVGFHGFKTVKWSSYLKVSTHFITNLLYITNLMVRVERRDGFLDVETRKYRIIMFVLNPEARDEKVLKFVAPAFGKQTRYKTLKSQPEKFCQS